MLLQLLLIALTVTVVSNCALVVVMFLTWRSFVRGLHGPRFAFGNKYAKRDLLQGGPLSATGIVPTGLNVPVLQQDPAPGWFARLWARRPFQRAQPELPLAPNVVRLQPKAAPTQPKPEPVS